jgi:RimJ/RimL family protein N-acetyltransferase
MYVFDAPRIGKWICEKAGGEYAQGNQCFGIEKDGKLVAGVNYYGYMGENATIYMGWRIDNPQVMTRYFYWMIFDYPFNHAKVNRITLVINEFNAPCVKVVEKLGFKCEARLESYFPKCDALVYRMFRKECRFLGEKYAVVKSIKL